MAEMAIGRQPCSRERALDHGIELAEVGSGDEPAL